MMEIVERSSAASDLRDKIASITAADLQRAERFLDAQTERIDN